MIRKQNRKPRNVLHRAVISSAAIVSTLAFAPDSPAAITETWNSAASGNWTTASLWSPSANYPNNGTPAGVTYDAVINATGSAYTVTFNSNITLDSLTLNSANATLNHTSGTLTAANGISLQAGSYTLAGGTIQGGTITASGGTQLIAATQLSTLNGVTLDANVSIGNSVLLTVQNNVALVGGATVTLGSAGGNAILSIKPGTQTISGNGQIVFAGSTSGNYINLGDNSGATTLTLGSGVTVRGRGFIQHGSAALTSTLLNQGIIQADVSGQSLILSPTTLTNTGTIKAQGGGTLDLNTTIPVGGLGTFDSTGGTVRLLGTLTNTSNTLALSGVGNVLTLFGGTINGGTISATGGAALLPDFGTLSGVTLASDVTIPNQKTLTIANGLTLSGGAALTLASTGSNTFLVIKPGTQTISGTGQIVFGGSASANYVNLGESTGSTTLTLGPGITVRGRGNIQHASAVNVSTLNNQGAIQADVNGQSLTLTPTVFNNFGALKALNGATLSVGGAWTNTGTIDVNASTLNLGGSFTGASATTSFTRTGGTVNITGTLSGGLDLDANTGSWVLAGGTLSGGTVSASGGSQLLTSTQASILNGVSLDAPVSIGNSVLLTVQNNLTLVGGATITLSSTVGNAILSIKPGTQTIGGTGQIVMAGTSSANYINLGDNSGATTLTLGPGVTVRGRGNIQHGSGALVSTLINQGTIQADVSGQSITLTPTVFTNSGTVRAQGSGTLTVSNNAASLTNLSGGTLTGGVWQVISGGILNFGTATISSNAANVTLDGASSAFAAINNFSTNSGTFTVTGGRTFNAAASFNNTSTGTMNASTGGTINFTTGQNNGTIDSQPGGTINFAGNFSHNAGSTLRGSGAVNFTGGVQQFDGTLIGDIDLNLAGATPNFGGSFNGQVNSLSVSSGVTTYAAGAKLTVGVGGVNFSGATSPSLALASGSTPAQLVLNGDVTLSSNPSGLKQILTTGSGATDGTVDLGGAQRIFTIAQGIATPDLLISARVINGSLRKSGTGVLALTNANTYAGGTTLAAGAVEVTDVAGLGTGAVTFSGGILNLRSNLTTANYANLISVGATNTASIDINRISAGSANTFHFGSTTLGTALNVSGAGTLQFAGATLAHDLSITNFASLDFNGPIAGSFAITGSTGAGTTIFSGTVANTHTGLTRWNAGTLQLNKSPGVNAIAADVSVFTGATVRWLASDQVSSTSPLTINGSTSTADLNGQSDTIGAVSMTAGTLAVGSGTLTATGAFTVNNSVANANITGSGTFIAGSANIQSNVTRSGGGVTKITGMPTIAAGKKIDLTDTRLIVAGGTLGSWNGTNYDGVTGLIKAGRNGGAWTGTQIVTSMTDAVGTSALTTLAIAAAGDVGKTTFAGQSVAAGDVLVMYTYAGDANLTGSITGDDYFRIDNGYTSHLTGYANGDFDFSGRIDADDYFIIDHNYGHQTGTFASAPPIDFAGVSAVPEPAAVGLFGMLSAQLLRRRRRN